MGGWWELIFMKRVNWKKEGITELQYRYGFDRNMAELQWERAYHKALRQVRKGADTKELNVAREVYSSAFYRGTQLFDINFDDLTPSVKVADAFAQTDNIEKAFIEQRFGNMAKKYSEVDKLVKRYKSGKMSYDTFKEKIKQFKDTNREYQKSGS